MAALALLAYLGGVLTIVSPCVLPVIPFVFAAADRPFRRSGLPMLVGMGIMFTLLGLAASAGGGWVVNANEWGRRLAMVVLALLGLTLLLPSLADLLSRPLVRLGARVQRHAAARESIGSSLVLGGAIGLLWAPCAGPVLGLVLAAAALSGASARSVALLAAFALGAATSLAVALLAGGRAFAALKRGLGAEAWIRRALGVLVLAAVAAIALGLDTRFLAAFSYINTNGLEQRLVSHLDRRHAPAAAPVPVAAATRAVAADAAAVAPVLDDEGALPAFTGATAWINSPPLTPAELRGKVVLIDFWTYSCINCLRSLPYVEAWAQRYKNDLVVIGVHTPEFAFEAQTDNVRQAVKRLGLTYPIVVDSQRIIWSTFDNEYWPADYLVDARGEIRYHYFGEGDYAGTERAIQELIADAHPGIRLASAPVAVDAGGAEAAPDMDAIASPETYIGFGRAENFVSPQHVPGGTLANYTTPATLALNQWGLNGTWRIDADAAHLQAPGGGISFHFHARDLHLVMGADGDRPIPFRVTIDGAPPGADHGADTDAAGNGTLTGQRLYQLIRQQGAIGDHVFHIEFLQPGVQAYSFTFG